MKSGEGIKMTFHQVLLVKDRRFKQVTEYTHVR